MSQKGVAEELAEGQRSISVSEFFKKNKHMLGFDSGARSLITATKEGVDNSLDAAEEAGILPDIHVNIEKSGENYRLTIRDNGPGITEEQIPKVFGKLLYGSRFHRRVQSRGQQGIGISAAVLYAQLTTGKPAEIVSKTEANSKARYFELSIDTDSNEPEILRSESTNWEGSNHGTEITIELDANMRARQQLHSYIEYTSVVNPHATITLEEPKKQVTYERVTDTLPDETKEIKPHPHGIELGTLQNMLFSTDEKELSAFLQTEFTRVGEKSAKKIIRNYIDKEYGRQIALDTSSLSEEIKISCQESVNGKSKDATEGYSECVAEKLSSEKMVAYRTVPSVVRQCASESEDKFGERFGGTVRDTSAAAVWSEILENQESFFESVVSSATSSQKKGEVVEVLAKEMYTRIKEVEKLTLTRERLRSIVDSSSDAAQEKCDSRVGDKARENITTELWNDSVRVPLELFDVSDIEGDREKETSLLGAMTETDLISPPSDCLSPIKPELIKQGLKSVYSADFYASSTRDASVHSGSPFIAEAGIAFGGELEEGQAEFLRFANRVPLVYQRGACTTTKVVEGIGWRNYKVSQPKGRGLPEGPMVIMVHVASTNVPFTSESKDAIAGSEVIEKEVELAIREAARELKSYLSEKEKHEKRRSKRQGLREIYPDLASKAVEVTRRDEELDWKPSLAAAMNDTLIKRDETGGDKATLTVENYTEDTQEFTVTEVYQEKPDGRRVPRTEDVALEEANGNWQLKFSITLESCEEVKYSYPKSDIVGEPKVDGITTGTVTTEVIR